MERTELTSRLEEILSDLLQRPLSSSMDGETSLRDLGLGSLRMIQLLGDLEAVFGIRIADDEVSAENFATLKTLEAFVLGKSMR